MATRSRRRGRCDRARTRPGARGYGFAPRAARLTGERDENFKLTPLTARITSSDREPGRSQPRPLSDAALLHIEKTVPALPCPRVLRDRHGGTHVRFVDEGVERTGGYSRISPETPRYGARITTPKGACGWIERD